MGFLRHRQPAAHGERRALPHSPRRRGAAHSREGRREGRGGITGGSRGQCVESAAPARRGPYSPAYCARTPSASRAARSSPPPTATPRSYTAAHTPPSITSRATPLVILDQPGRFAEAARNYIKRVTELVTGLVSAGKLSAVPEGLLHALRRRHAPPEGPWRCIWRTPSPPGRYAVSPKSIVTVRAKQLPQLRRQRLPGRGGTWRPTAARAIPSSCSRAICAARGF